MSKDNLIAIAFSDLHCYKFNLFNKDNSRLNWTLTAFECIARTAARHKVPLLFCGDLFHTPASVENETLGLMINSYMLHVEQTHTPFFAISGNHDLCQKNSLDHKSPSYLDIFFEVFTTFKFLDPGLPFPISQGFKIVAWVWGIPYMNNDADIKKKVKQLKKDVKEDKYKGAKKILMLHTDCPGALNDEDIEVGECESMPSGKKHLAKFFEDWDLVLFGHIHKPQQLFKHGYMLGSPIHQVSNDKAEMGYWKIFNDRAPQFIGLANIFPRFRKLVPGEVPDNEKDYFIMPDDQGLVEEVEKGDFDLSHSRTKLAKRYMKVKGIKDKKKKAALINILNQVE